MTVSPSAEDLNRFIVDLMKNQHMAANTVIHNVIIIAPFLEPNLTKSALVIRAVNLSSESALGAGAATAVCAFILKADIAGPKYSPGREHHAGNAGAPLQIGVSQAASIAIGAHAGNATDQNRPDRKL